MTENKKTEAVSDIKPDVVHKKVRSRFEVDLDDIMIKKNNQLQVWNGQLLEIDGEREHIDEQIKLESEKKEEDINQEHLKILREDSVKAINRLGKKQIEANRYFVKMEGVINYLKNKIEEELSAVHELKKIKGEELSKKDKKNKVSNKNNKKK